MAMSFNLELNQTKPQLWHGIISAAAPRMAPAKTPCSEFKCFEKTIFFKRFYPIFRARRGKPATFCKQRRQGILIKPNEQYGQLTD